MFFVHAVIYVCCALSLSLLATCARIYVKSEKRERKERKAQ